MGRRGTLLRLLSLVLILQGTGLIHLVSEWLGKDEAGCSERCASEGEAEGAQCPPFCPTCMCVHGSQPSLPVLLVMLAPPIHTSETAPGLERQSGPPKDPGTRGVFHPPRS